MNKNLNEFIGESIKKNWELPAFTDYKSKTTTYKETAHSIVNLHEFFNGMKLKENDKVALLGSNSTNWATVYLSVISYGLTIIPILPDFSPSDIHHIVNHSDSVLLFSDSAIAENLDPSSMQKVEMIISVNNFEPLYSRKVTSRELALKLMGNLSINLNISNRNEFKLKCFDGEKTAAIIYTSGTTGFSKGVILPHRSLIANIMFAHANMPLNPGDTIVSFLPIAHVFGCAFEFLFPFSCGCHITFLGKTPAPKLILQAFSEIKPRLILTVPLVIEKIYHKRVRPKLNQPAIRTLLKTPGVSTLIKKMFNKKLTNAFGGNFMELVIGGAPLSKEVEDFFKDINLRFTVGYGMTECGPLISYTNWSQFKPYSTGKIVDSLEIKIDSPDPYNTVGEIMVKGENVMAGYYKNQEATLCCLDEKGWLRTGDLGFIDKDKTVYIKGRCKSMILGPSGKNIYPEEIESKLNSLPYVMESIVKESGNKLIALVYPDFEAADMNNLSEDQIKVIIQENLKKLNSNLPKHSVISKIEVYTKEFEKTPKRSIKRYLYSR